MNRIITQLLDLIQNSFEYIQDNPEAWLWFGLFSFLTFVGTLIVVPWIILQLPADYFDYSKPPRVPWARAHPLLRLVLLIAKNMLGACFILLGLLLLVLPGQGLLTLVFGILLMDFPGKYRLKAWLFRQRSIRRSVNWLRLRYKREPLRFPTKPPDGTRNPG